MDLARLDRDHRSRPDLISDDVQTPPISCAPPWSAVPHSKEASSFCGLLEYSGLRADGEHVPSLKGIDGLT